MNPSDVAQRLQTLVEMSGATPNAVSELARLDRTYLRLILTGQRTAFGAMPMASLARVLGASLDWLIAGEGRAPTREEVRAAVERARATELPATGTDG